MARTIAKVYPISLRRSKVKVSINFKSFVKKVFILVVVLLMTLSGVLFFQINDKVAKEYLLRQYERELERASEELQELQAKAVQSDILTNALNLLTVNSPSNEKFEQIDKIYYIRLINFGVAAK